MIMDCSCSQRKDRVIKPVFAISNEMEYSKDRVRRRCGQSTQNVCIFQMLDFISYIHNMCIHLEKKIAAWECDPSVSVVACAGHCP